MANRRMISKDIVESMPFLQMTLSSQALYMHLLLNADDDGVANAFIVMRMTGASPGELDNLLRQGFVKWVVEDKQVLVINDFTAQNAIQGSKYTPSRYRNLLKNKYPELLRKRPALDDKSNGRTIAGILPDNCRHSTVQDSLVQDSLVQCSTDKDRQVQCDAEVVAVDNLEKYNRFLDLAEILRISKKDSRLIAKKYGLDIAMKYLKELDRQVTVGIKITNPGGWLNDACKNKYNIDL